MTVGLRVFLFTASEKKMTYDRTLIFSHMQIVLKFLYQTVNRE